MKIIRILLLVIAVVCIGVAVSYPIKYQLELHSNKSELEDLSAMRMRVREEVDVPEDEGAPWPVDEPEAGEESAPEAMPTDEAEAASTGEPEAPPTDEPETVSTDGAEAVPTGEPKAVPTGEPEAAPTGAAETTSADAGQPDQAGTIEPEERPSASAAQQTPPPTPTPQPVDTPTPVPTQRPVFVLPEYHGPTQAPGASPTPSPGIMDLIIQDPVFQTPTPSPSPTPSPTPSPSPSPTPDRTIRTGAATYSQKEKVKLDESRILPELKDIYALNHDLVGWLVIPDTLVDYPVVQTDDSEFYLKHDFYGNDNANGQIILDSKCDPYTPSYNLVISGHHMNSGAMFGRLPQYKNKEYWEEHKLVEFDTLMARKQYVIFAVFYSADYDEHEEGFRYNADIQYKIDAEQWLAEIRENQIYDTGIEAEFGDEFITLTTCDHARRRDGRFVAVARRIREGENFK